MKKFAAIAAVSCILLSVFCLAASAKLFTTDSSYKYTCSLADIGMNVSTGITCYKFEVLVGGKVVYNQSFDGDVLVVRNYSSGTPSTVVAPEFKVYDDDVLVDELYTFTNLPLYGSSVVFYSKVAGQDFTVVTETEPAAVGAVSNRMFSVGDSIITFVTSHWIPLLALSAFVLVFCTQGIRKLIKGV